VHKSFGETYDAGKLNKKAQGTWSKKDMNVKEELKRARNTKKTAETLKWAPDRWEKPGGGHLKEMKWKRGGWDKGNAGKKRKHINRVGKQESLSSKIQTWDDGENIIGGATRGRRVRDNLRQKK